jgi:glycosyltransferase involved in cell wall biosynthesis
MNRHCLKIAFLTSETAQDKRSYSGSLYYMGRTLEQHCGEVIYLNRVISWEKRYLGRLMHEATSRVLRKNVAYDRLLFVARRQSAVAARRLQGQHFDVIVAPNCVPEIAFLQTSIPILLPLDVTFRLQRDYYPLYSHLLAYSARQAERVETAAYQNASMLLFSSPWAARSAIQDYGIDQHKVRAYFFGANLDHIPTREQALARLVRMGRDGRDQSAPTCRLLFMGVGWERKGGDIAYETLLALEALGIEAELTVCGSMPPSGLTHAHMKVISYLDKNDERQAREIEKLYAQADFLLLPTRADCAPNVFKEANAFGLPTITTATGGVADIVRDGENGYALPYEARGDAYARVIAAIWQDEARYNQLAQSSRAAYDERLSWEAWAKAVHEIMHEIC